MKERKRYVGFISLVLCAMLLVGCNEKGGEKDGEYRVYYINTEESGLMEENCDLEGDTVRAQVEEMLTLLKKDPEELNAKSTFSESITVKEWSLVDKKLKLHFNGEYKELDAASEILLRAAVVQSLTQINGVDRVEIFVGSKPLTNKDGREIGSMTAGDFVQNTGSSLHSYQRAELTLYFGNSAGTKLVPGKVNVRYNSNTLMEKLIVEQLIKGPGTMEGQPVIPPETKILGVSVKDHVCYVNLDEGFQNMTNSNPKLTVYSLVNSIIEGGGASRVQILINGESNIVYQESVDLSKPLSKDSELIEVKED